MLSDVETYFTQIVISLVEYFGNGFISIDDYALSHIVQIINEVLRDNDIEERNWPANSSHVNFVEQNCKIFEIRK